ncbi:MAG TPA: ketol-acid reductoisomerase [Anaerolineae bacterium]|nr:ketol-acid reductoisomerase [Anaerolineae bacterium]
MVHVYRDDDADLSVLDGRKVAIIGYGNQGRAQGLNMRDSGVEVLVGNIEDASFDRAEADGFPTMSIAKAIQAGDVLCLFLPDEVQQEVYRQDIAPLLRSGQTLNFAHGYNIRYGFIRPPKDVDVIMVAPRMIGVGVRERFEAGSGAPAFVAVEQDATGLAWPTTLAIAKAIGATRIGALKTTFAEETELDHFSEQAVWPVIVRLLTMAYELLTNRGYQPEAVLLELYASGEAAQVFQEMAEVGLFRQMSFHSQTSQYGTLSRASRVLPDDFRMIMAQILDEIQQGTFAQEWEAERQAGYPRFRRLKAEALSHRINDVENSLWEIMQGSYRHSEKALSEHL